MIIDAKKIIPYLSVPLEDEEWEKFKKKELGPLISLTYTDIIRAVGEFTGSATRELKSETTEDVYMGEMQT